MDGDLLVFLIGLFTICAIFVLRSNKPISNLKGKAGEKKVHNILSKLPAEYTLLEDVVLFTERGTTQIDHVVVSKYGVFAIETKNYRGDIYGDDDRQNWTQIIVTKVRFGGFFSKVYTYVTKNQMYNPVKQSLGHVFALRKALQEMPYLSIESIVVFVGEANLSHVKTNHKVIYGGDLLSTIMSYTAVRIPDADVSRIVEKLKKRNVNDIVDNKTHIKNFKLAEQRRNETIQANI